jgi:talin
VAYLVAIAHPSTEPGVVGLVNQGQLSLALQSIEHACLSLAAADCTKSAILDCATTIAKYTSLLCSECKSASSNTRNPVAKKEFLAYAKDIAQGTGTLVASIKALSANKTKEASTRCSKDALPLLASVKALITYSSNPEFLSTPSVIAPAARDQQVPITDAGKAMIAASCALLLSAKSLVAHPKDPPTWQELALQSKTVSDAIKQLVGSVRDKAPGQAECEDAIFLLNSVVGDLDQAELSLSIGAGLGRAAHYADGLEDSLVVTIDTLTDLLPSLASAAKSEAEKIARIVFTIMNIFR